MVVDPFDPLSRARPQVITNSNHSSPTASSLNNPDPDDDDAFEVSVSLVPSIVVCHEICFGVVHGEVPYRGFRVVALLVKSKD